MELASLRKARSPDQQVTFLTVQGTCSGSSDGGGCPPRPLRQKSRVYSKHAPEHGCRALRHKHGATSYCKDAGVIHGSLSRIIDELRRLPGTLRDRLT